MTMRAFDADGNEVHIGDDVVSFRGERAILVSLARPEMPGKSGKVVVSWPLTLEELQNWSGRAEYYDKVFNLTVKDI